MAGTFLSLQYHLVFSTKNREPLIAESFRDRLYEYMGGIIRSEADCEKCGLLNIGGMPDHVHLLVRWPAKKTLSDLMRVLKSKSTAWVNNEIKPEMAFAWQEGYGAFTVSLSEMEAVTRYIQNQEEHHRVRSFKEEFILFLDKHEVSYDESLIWK